LVCLRLDNGVLIEAVWDDHRHLYSVTGYEMHADEKQKALRERSTPNREWVPGMVNTLAWELAFAKVEACGSGPDG
jgi:hypothetical protein